MSVAEKYLSAFYNKVFCGCTLVMYEFSAGVKRAFELCQMSLMAPIGSFGPEGQRIGHAKTSQGR